MRRRLMLATLGVVALALAILTTGFYIALSHRLEADADAVMRSQAEALASRLTIDGGRLAVEPSATSTARSESSAAWVYTSDGVAVLRSPGSSGLEDEAAALAPITAPTFHDVSDGVRLFAQPVYVDGGGSATVVVSQLRAPYEHTEAIALRGAIVLDLLVLGGVALLASWLITSALRPVAEMTRQADEWSAHDLDRRFELGPPKDELTQLAATLDQLLDRLAASLRHEQNLSNEVAHELRTPLARLRTEVEVALRRPRTPDELRATLHEIVRDIESLDDAILSLLRTSRRDPALRSGRCDAREVVGEAIDALRPTAAARGVAIDFESGAATVVGTDAELLTRMLGPVLANAVTYAESQVGVDVVRAGQEVLITVTDDGPGLAPNEVDEVFAPGLRGEAGRSRHQDGHGLGLALARRLAHGGGGDIRAAAGPGGRFVIALPPA